MELRIYYYENLLSLKIRTFYEIFILRKFGAIQYCLSDNNEVWSDRLSDKRIRREPKGLSCICLVDCESDPYVRSIVCMV